MSDNEPGWERKVLEKLALAAVQEQRRARHWSIFFKTLGFLYLVALLVVFFGWYKTGQSTISGEHTALVDMQGEISANRESADKIIDGLDAAFKDSKTKGGILRINSPGGSPVQAGEIYDEMMRLRAKYPKIPLYVVVDDMCASGGYYVASAADKIYVNKASIVGSIGVLMDGFGFTGTMDKLGVQRRLLTAGKNKDFLDPFSPEVPSQVAYAKQMLQQIHQQFIDAVEAGRGSRLKLDTPGLFSGLMWTGQDAVKIGLADGYGSVDSVARDVIHAKNIVDYTPRNSLVDRFAQRFGVAMARTLGIADAAQPWHLR